MKKTGKAWEHLSHDVGRHKVGVEGAVPDYKYMHNDVYNEPEGKGQAEYW